MRSKATVVFLFTALLLMLVGGAAPAQAFRELLVQKEEGRNTIEWLITKGSLPPPEGQIEGACGAAVDPSGKLYVSDYYHHVVDIFAGSGHYISQIPIVVPPGVPPAIPPEGPCGLAVDPNTGALFANDWHERVVRLTPTVQMFDAGKSTGVAVDESGNVYVNDRTYVAVYAPTGTQILQVGLGSLGDAYGLAVDPAGERIYVPDAQDNTIKVYEPAIDLFDPVEVIDGSETSPQRFVSLVDAGVTVDSTNGHLLVADNLKPGYEEPQAAIYEFDDEGDFLGKLPGAPVHGEPTGLAVDPADGRLFVTTGKTEKANAFAYGPFSTTPLAVGPPGEAPDGSPEGPVVSTRGTATNPSHAGGATASEIVQRRGVRVSFDGKLTPRALPRRGAAPVGIAVDARIAATNGGDPPQLRRIAIEINRHGHFTPRGLSLCRLGDIQPSTTTNALAACRNSLVGEGHFSANVKLPEQSPFPSEGKVLAFNGRLGGKPAILAHIYGTQPAPTSYRPVLPDGGVQGHLWHSPRSVATAGNRRLGLRHRSADDAEAPLQLPR